MLARARTPSSTKSLREFGFRCICLLRTAVALMLPPCATCVACTLWCDSQPISVALSSWARRRRRRLPSRCCCRRVRLALRAHFGETHIPFPLLDPPGRVVVVVAAAAAAVVVLLLLLLLCRDGTVRSFNLEHHTILFQQTPAASVWSFAAAALEGALTGALHALRVLLVGPAGAETHAGRSM